MNVRMVGAREAGLGLMVVGHAVLGRPGYARLGLLVWSALGPAIG